MPGDKFKPGDRVRLRSGGPTMTVEEYTVGTIIEGYRCQWFDGKHQLQTQTFAEAVLEALSSGDSTRPLQRS